MLQTALTVEWAAQRRKQSVTWGTNKDERYSERWTESRAAEQNRCSEENCKYCIMSAGILTIYWYAKYMYLNTSHYPLRDVRCSYNTSLSSCPQFCFCWRFASFVPEQFYMSLALTRSVNLLVYTNKPNQQIFWWKISFVHSHLQLFHQMNFLHIKFSMKFMEAGLENEDFVS